MQTNKKDQKTLTFKRVFYFALPFLILIPLMLILLPIESSPFFFVVIFHVITFSTVLIALILGILSSKEHKNIEFKETTLFISLFLFFFLLREIFWLVLNLGAKGTILGLFIFLIYSPMWLLAYLPLYYLGVKTTMRYYEYVKIKNLIIVFIVCLILVIVFIFLLGYNIIIFPFPILTKIFLLSYPLLNIGIITLMLFILNIYKSGFMSEYWLFITFGIIMFSIGDSIEGYNILYSQYIPISIVFILIGIVFSSYVYSYLIFTIGFLWVYISKTNLIKIMPEGEYHVNEIFLIHSNGVALRHTKVEKSIVKIDEQMLTSMLTAIQDFVKTSFNIKGVELKEIYYGSFVMSIEKGSYISVAVISLGRVTKQFHKNMTQAIKVIEEKLSKELQNFDGDISKFENADKHLKELIA